MIAVDTNVLIYGHRSEFPEHRIARRFLANLVDGRDLWALPVFGLAEFLRVVTHPAILKPPSSLAAATRALEALLNSSSVRVLMPGDRFPGLLLQAVVEAHATGNLVFDAQIVAVCREHGVARICTHDRDFGRFRGIKVQRLTS